MLEHKIWENVNNVGQYAISELNKFKNKYPNLINDVRGKGLLIGIELVPEAGGARRFCEELKNLGILAKETHDNVIRFAPPLIIDKETINWAIQIINDVLLMD